MAKLHNYDTSTLYSDLPAPKIIKQFDCDIYEFISSFPEIRNRAEGFIQFINQIKNEDSRPFLRAALSEFCSMIDIADIQYEYIHKKEINFKNEIKDSRIQILRLLRHANVHLVGSNLSLKTKNASATIEGITKDFDFNYLIVPNLRESVNKTRESERWDTKQLNQTLDWFELQQNSWGIANTIQRICEICIRALHEMMLKSYISEP